MLKNHYLVVHGLNKDKDKDGGNIVHTLLMGGTIGLGTLHNVARKIFAVGGWVVQVRSSLWLRIKDRAECGNIHAF